MKLRILRTKNVGLKEKVSKSDPKLIVRHGEYEEDVWVSLLDKYGYLRSWATMATVSSWVADKGYKILEAEGFDRWFEVQEKRDGYRWDDISTLDRFVKNEIKMNQKMAQVEAELAKAKKANKPAKSTASAKLMEPSNEQAEVRA